MDKVTRTTTPQQTREIAALLEIALLIRGKEDFKVEFHTVNNADHLEFWSYENRGARRCQHLEANTRMSEAEFKARISAIIKHIKTGKPLPNNLKDAHKPAKAAPRRLPASGHIENARQFHDPLNFD